MVWEVDTVHASCQLWVLFCTTLHNLYVLGTSTRLLKRLTK